jgi:hypothetical protein
MTKRVTSISHENEALDEAQLAAWIVGASRLPGWGNASQRLADVANEHLPGA